MRVSLIVGLLVGLALCADAEVQADGFGPFEKYMTIQSAATCDFCKVIITLISDVVQGKTTEKDAAAVALEYCMWNSGALGYHCDPRGDSFECHDMCSGAIRIFEPEVFSIAAQKMLNPETHCVKLGYCAATDTTRKMIEEEPVLDRIRVIPPALPKRSRPKSKEGADGIIRILQVTDIHHDPNYTPGTKTNCGQPLCCRDVPYTDDQMNSTTIAGTYGDYNCDAPYLLLASMIDALQGIYPPPDYGFLTGDDPPHNVWNQTQEYNVNVSRMIAKLFADGLPNTTFFPVLGNHNGFPVNQFHVVTSEDQPWLYGPLSETYSQWLNASSVDTFNDAGFYVASMTANLSVIVLNSNFHNSDNYWLVLDDGDIAGMFYWFQETLAQMRADGRRAYVLQHHPALSTFANYSNAFSDVLAEYDDVVVAAFFGHSHDDEYFIYSGGNVSNPQPAIVGFIPGAGTPNGQNPSFRIYDVDAATGELIDFHHYRPDLQAQGLINNNSTDAPKPIWNPQYSARSFYNLTSMDASQWYQVGQRMMVDDDLFSQYFFQYQGGHNRGGPWTPNLRVDMVCNILGGSVAGYNYCMQHPTAFLP